MTNNDTLSSTDPRTLFAHALITARPVIAGVQPDQMTLPTVCAELDVQSMLGHMLTVLHRIAALGNGDDPMAMPEFVTGIADDGWTEAFLEGGHEVQVAWTDAAKLDQMMVLPWATAPGAAMLAMYTAELTVHTWDLAQATGQTVHWHEPSVEASLAWALQGIPGGDREAHFAALANQPGFRPDLALRPPFRNAVAVPDTASTLDRLIGWYGRKPQSPSAA